MKQNNFIRRLFSCEGIAFMLLSYMLYSKIYGDGRYMLLTMLMCIFVLPLVKNRHWDEVSKIILFFSATYSITCYFFHYENSIFFLLFFGVSPVFFYLYGKILIEKLHSDEEVITFWLIESFFLAAVIYGIVGVTGKFNVGVDSGRALFLNEDSDQGFSATVIGIYVSTGLVGLGTALYVVKNNLLRLLWGLLFFMSISTVIYFENRTGLVVAGVVFLAMFWYNSSNQTGNAVKYGIIILFLLLLVYWLGFIDVSVYNAYEARASENTANERIYRWGLGIQYLFIYPFGWANKSGAFDGYIHNMWLDAGRKGGIMSFILLLSLTISSAKCLRRLLKYERTPFTLFFLGLYVCFFFSSLVEPIIEALPQYLMLFMMLWGMMKRYEELNTQNKF